jgi:dolichol-phosphate mannosyltransferase
VPTTFLKGVSVVTTTWNEKENIKKLIPKIREALKSFQQEIIVIDDNSPDGTFQIAKKLADIAQTKTREGQTKGLLQGMRLAKYPLVVTIDSDLENPPELIPKLVQRIGKFDITVASRTTLPRLSEKIASKTLGKLIGVTDSFSNYRAFKKETISKFNLKGGETFGAEFLVIAKKKGLRIGEVTYEPPLRRTNPRIGGSIEANLRIGWALVKTLILYALCPSSNRWSFLETQKLKKVFMNSASSFLDF